MKARVDKGLCRWGKCDCGCCCECRGCLEACPAGAISGKDRVVIDAELCAGCGACVKACPCGAISLF